MLLAREVMCTYHAAATVDERDMVKMFSLSLGGGDLNSFGCDSAWERD